MGRIALFFVLAFALTFASTAVAQPPVRSFDNSSVQSSNNATDFGVQTAAPQGTTNQGTLAARFATNRREFQIPFAVQTDIQIIVQLTLFQSADRGRTWQIGPTARPGDGSFTFTADRDGEFWFAVQTTNRNGAKIPPRIVQPDIIVVVDTVLPQITSSARDDAAGRINVRWRAVDDYIATESLTIRYRPTDQPDSEWTTLPVQNQSGKAIGPVYQDSLAFWPEGNSPSFEVEVAIQDSAGNTATATNSVIIQQPAPRSAWTQANQRQLESQTARRRNANSAESIADGKAQDNATQSIQANNNSPHGTAPQYQPQQSFEPRAVVWESQSSSTPAIDTPPKTLGETSIAIANPNPTKLEQPPAPTDSRLFTAPPPTNSEFQNTSTVIPPTGNHASTSIQPTPLSPTGRITSINTSQFRLNYKLERVALAEVDEVAVWVTRDAGNSWFRLGTAADPAGPYTVEVDQSGLYGFRLVVSMRTGAKSPIPQSGDQPEKWVRVDLEPPIVNIESVPFGIGADAGKLIINWRVIDDLLAPRPIDLAYSTDRRGPWTTIESDLRNDGRYVWPINNDTPSPIYLRVTARDEAGNVATAESNYPIDLTLLYPRGEIESIEPIR